MKRKLLVTILSLIMGLSIVACGKQETTATTESTVAVESTEVETTVTEETVITADATETYIEQVEENTSETEETTTTSTSETTTTTRTDYPDSNPSHQKAWDNFCSSWNESDYGTTTKGKVMNDFQYYGDTGYDPNGTILQERTTDKGYKVMYDTETGRVYYTGMTLPTGDGWIERESGSAAVITQYIIDNNLTGIYDITYSQFQELLGTYSGD